MAVVYNSGFPNMTAHASSVGAYRLVVEVEPAGQATCNVFVQLQSTSDYTWWVSNGGPVNVWIDGAHVYSSTIGESFSMPGVGLQGVVNSNRVHVATRSINKNSTLRVTVDCSVVPTIYPPSGGTYTLGVADTGNMVNWPGIQFTTPATLALSNNNPYNSQQPISAYENQINVRWTKTRGDNPATVYGRIRLSTGTYPGYTNFGTANPLQFTGLAEGTSYRAQVWSWNEGGNGNSPEINIRTLHAVPAVTLTMNHAESGLEDLTINWNVTNGKKVQQVEYKMSKVEADLSTIANWTVAQTGLDTLNSSFIVTHLEPNTRYYFMVRFLSTSAFDGRYNTGSKVNEITDDRAQIQGLYNPIFGEQFYINKLNESGNTNDIEIYAKVEADTNWTLIWRFNMNENTGYRDFNQARLDQMYRMYKKTNTISFRIGVVTIGKYIHSGESTVREYRQSISGKLTLKGNAKTAHIGVTNNVPKRAKAWIGIDGTPKRAVMWVGTPDGPKRCI